MLALRRIRPDPLDVLRYIHDTPEDVVPRRQPAGEEGHLRAVGHADQRYQGQQHRHRSEGEPLGVRLLVVPRIVDQRGQAHHGLAAADPDHEGDYVRGQTAVRVAVLFEVDHHQELREEDHVDQVRAHRPETVDRGDRQRHHRAQHAHHAYASPHYPDDLHFRRLCGGIGCKEDTVRIDRLLEAGGGAWRSDGRETSGDEDVGSDIMVRLSH